MKKTTITRRDVEKGVRKPPVRKTRVIPPDDIYNRRDKSWQNWQDDSV